MAQLGDARQGGAAKVRQALRQRPWMAVVLAVAVVGVVVVVVLGVTSGSRATQFTVTRAEGSEAAVVPDAEKDGDKADEGKADEDEAAEEDADGEGETAELLVDVGGAVASPGLVSLAPGARVNDAVAAAGGLTAEADTASLNLAAKVEDGQKVYVPRQGEAAPVQATPAAGGTGTAGAAEAQALVNINTATAEELDALPGVGPSTAQAIIEERETNGAFTSVEDIMRVSGIGEKKFEKLQGSICV